MKAVILTGEGPDLVSLVTDLPDPIPPEGGGGKSLFLDFKTPPRKAEGYCREVLGVTIIETIQR